MNQVILQEVVSIRNRLGSLLIAAEPKIGKEWKMFTRMNNAHQALMGIEIDKNTQMADDRQPELPGMPGKPDNLCKSCGVFDDCGFEVKKAQGVSDCEDFQLSDSSEPGSGATEPTEGEGTGVTPIQDMPRTELPADLTKDEQQKLEDIKADYQIESLASFEVVPAENDSEEHIVSLCGHKVGHKTLKGAVLFLFQELGYPCQTPEALKEELMKFPESDKRDLILSFLAPESPEKRAGRKKKSDQ